MDFGMSENLNLLSQGRLKLHEGWRPLTTADGSKQPEVTSMISDPAALFVGHARGLESEQQVRPRLDSAALSTGRRRQVVQAIKDVNGREVFEVFRFEPSAPLP
jgi:hypothetical protein